MVNVDMARPFAEFCHEVNSFPADAQNRFFQSLKGKISDEEIKSLQIGVSVWGMMENPEKMAAIKKAVGEKLYEEFNR